MVFGLIFFIDVLLLVVLAVGEFATGELKGDIMLIIEVAKDINSGAGTEIIDWFSSLASLTLIGVLLWIDVDVLVLIAVVVGGVFATTELLALVEGMLFVDVAKDLTSRAGRDEIFFVSFADEVM